MRVAGSSVYPKENISLADKQRKDSKKRTWGPNYASFGPCRALVPLVLPPRRPLLPPCCLPTPYPPREQWLAAVVGVLVDVSTSVFPSVVVVLVFVVFVFVVFCRCRLSLVVGILLGVVEVTEQKVAQSESHALRRVIVYLDKQVTTS